MLTGAGLSTDSGIPDYRGPGLAGADADDLPGVRLRARAAQQRYWARSHLGWGRMRRAEPNAGHRALAALDPELLITQNVDGLHEAAGSRRLVALHGRIADVVCLGCRDDVAARGAAGAARRRSTPGSPSGTPRPQVRPDGDVELDDTG